MSIMMQLSIRDGHSCELLRWPEHVTDPAFVSIMQQRPQPDPLRLCNAQVMHQQAMLSNGPFDRPGVSIQPGQICGDPFCWKLVQLLDWRQ
jgi:hypothetical protein